MTRERASGRKHALPTLPTEPSQPDARPGGDEPLCVTWFGPGAERMESVPSVDTPLDIGRSPSNQVVLGGREVSGRHARIEHADGKLEIRDLNSQNGVWVGGQRVASTTLSRGDVLRLGEWLGVVSLGRPGDFREVAPGSWGSACLERAVAKLRVVAQSPLHLILLGETGTGKELLARAAFEWSRANGEFVAINCATLPEALAEAELFGHTRGAFTGAQEARLGFVRSADKGLLFLDEVGELSLPVQAKLLRAIHEREVIPLGANKASRVNLRVVAATHRDLHQMAKNGTFRADLLARLEGWSARVPPLRERREDILPLFRAFARAALGRDAPPITPDLAHALVRHPWTANVRELKQVADRTARLGADLPRWTLHDVELYGLDDALPEKDTPPPKGPAVLHPRLPSIDQLNAALERSGGVVADAARSVGFSRQTVYGMLRQHGIDLKSFRKPS